jgi:Tfp pilus assembly protein PilX
MIIALLVFIAVMLVLIFLALVAPREIRKG